MSAAISASRAFGDEPRGRSPYRPFKDGAIFAQFGWYRGAFRPSDCFWDECAPFLLLEKSKMRNVKCEMRNVKCEMINEKC